MRVFYNFPSIYAFVNKITGKSYYGQATITSRRVNNELSLLRNSGHHSIHLQRSFNKRGEKNFGITIIENYSGFPEEFLQQAMDAHEEQIIKLNRPNYNCREGGKSSYKIPPETMAKLKIARERTGKDPEFRNIQRSKQKKIWSDPEYKEKMRQIQKENWKKNREKYVIAAKKYWANPENRKKKSEITKKAWDLLAKQEASSHSKEIWQDPSRLQQVSIKRKALWSNPEWRQKQIEKYKAGWEKRKALGLKRKPNSKSPSSSS